MLYIISFNFQITLISETIIISHSIDEDTELYRNNED